LQSMLGIGFTPHAMLWAPETPSAEKYRPAPEWRKFQRRWARPAIIHSGERPHNPDVKPHGRVANVSGGKQE